MKNLQKVLIKLKDGKCKDPAGFVNEMFKFDNIGETLKNSLLILLDKIKVDIKEPEFMKNSDIYTVYKGKGERTDLNNYRGLFILNSIKSIKDKLIHNNIYDIVHKNMSDSQVGATKGRNIRNHLFVVNSIIHDIKQMKKEL